jgi:hypothetical protein
MNISLITRHLDRSQTLIDLATRRAGYAFARFADLVDRIEIRLADINGPRGGSDVACLARLHLVRGGGLLVEGVAASPEAGVTKAVERLACRFRRLVARHHHHRT